MVQKRRMEKKRLKNMLEKENGAVDPAAQEIPEIKVVDKRFWAQEESPEQTGEETREISLKPSYVEELEAKVATMERKLAERLEEMDGEARRTRERLEKDLVRRVEEERNRVLHEFLEVVDNFDRAMETAEERLGKDPVFEGLTMIRTLFIRKMEKLGLSEYGLEGEVFDPSIHEAVQVVPVEAEDQIDRVVRVWQKGFRAGDLVVRPARVVVGARD